MSLYHHHQKTLDPSHFGGGRRIQRQVKKTKITIPHPPSPVRLAFFFCSWLAARRPRHFLVGCSSSREVALLVVVVVLPRAYREVGGGVVALEGNARVPNSEGRARKHNHGRLENHEQRLVARQLAVEAVAELGDAEDGAYKNGECGGEKTWRKKSAIWLHVDK